MRRKQLLTLLTLLLLWPLAACANNEPSAPSTTPPIQDSERLSAEVPENWQKIVDRKVGELHMVEYYPPGADENWQQKLTIESLTGRDLPDPLVYAAGLAEEQQGFCEDFKDNAVFAGFENGYPTTVHVLECGQSKRTGRSVVTMVKIIQGNKSLYTISRIWRLPAPVEAEQEATPMDQNQIAAWAHTLRKVQLCDAALDAHPCLKSES